MKSMKQKTGIGQDSHRFLPKDSSKPCMLAGVLFPELPGFSANSDGDVVLHAICNAISSISGELILGNIADELCQKDGITDSAVYLRRGLETLKEYKIIHVAICIEAKRPKIKERIEEMKKRIAQILQIDPRDVGITASTGEGLTDFGCGEGVQAFCCLSCIEDQDD